MTEREFAKREKQAEALLDIITFGRLKKGVPDEFAGSVADAMMILVEAQDGINEGWKAVSDGSQVSSFSNGVDSFSFANPGSSDVVAQNQARAVAVCRATEALPIELTSLCVSYNGALGGTA